MAYNINPQPLSGTNAYGYIPGPIGMPDPSADLTAQFGALPAANKVAGTDLLAELGGNITPGTRNALQLAAAQTGAGSGMPLSGLSQNALLGNIVGFSEGQVKQGMQDYASLIPTVSKTQTVDPTLQTEIANRNAMYAAAPDPTMANNFAQELFDKYVNSLRGPAGGTGAVGSPAAGDTSNWRAREAAYNAYWNPSAQPAQPAAGPLTFGAGGDTATANGQPAAPPDWTTSDPWGTGGFPGQADLSPAYNPLADSSYGGGQPGVNINDVLYGQF